jgi:hypothetical protein
VNFYLDIIKNYEHIKKVKVFHYKPGMALGVPGG